MRGFILHPSNPGLLQLAELPEPGVPGIGEVLVQHTAVGVNHTDVHDAQTASRHKQQSALFGIEAVGYVAAIGEQVEGFKQGMRVGYATGPRGAFCERRVISAKHLVSIPDAISDEVAASVLYKGITARYLTFRTFAVRAGNVVVVRGAAGGVGSLICQMVRVRKGIVVGTVGSEEKIAIAKAAGCSAVTLHNDPNLMHAIADLTKKQGASVLYDTIGGEQAWPLLNIIGSLGVYVAVGETAGALPPLDVATLGRFSGFVTKPHIADYNAARLEHVVGAYEVFDMVTNGTLAMPIAHTLAFEQIPDGLAAIAGRQVTGAIIAQI
jgi:NADPH2:quinone reductase